MLRRIEDAAYRWVFQPLAEAIFRNTGWTPFRVARQLAVATLALYLLDLVIFDRQNLSWGFNPIFIRFLMSPLIIAFWYFRSRDAEKLEKRCGVANEYRHALVWRAIRWMCVVGAIITLLAALGITPKSEFSRERWCLIALRDWFELFFWFFIGCDPPSRNWKPSRRLAVAHS
jgi:hypothetical protein